MPPPLHDGAAGRNDSIRDMCTPFACASTPRSHALEAAGQGRRSVPAATTGPLPPVGFSVGAVTFTRPPATPRHLLSLPDRLMYEVKALGKNDVRIETTEAVAAIR